MKKNKVELLINVISFLFLFTYAVLFFVTLNPVFRKITNVIIVLVAVFNLIYYFFRFKKIKVYQVVLLVGIIFSCLADGLLNLDFKVFLTLFLTGHLMYIVAFYSVKKFHYLDIIFSLIIFVFSASIILFVPIFNFYQDYIKYLCLIYALVLSVVVGKSFSNLILNKKPLTIVMFIGSIMFYISDFVLLFNMFATHNIILDVLCLSIYYPSVMIFSNSLLCTNSNNDKTDISQTK